MKKDVIAGILIIGIASTITIAAGPPVSYIFQGGDPASATQVNANFQELADRIDASSGVTYDFHDYLADPAIQAKEYKTTGRCGDTEIRSFVRTTVPGGTKVTMTRKDLNLGIACSHQEVDYLNTTDEYRYLENRGYDPATSIFQGGWKYDDPIAVLKNPMQINVSWVDATSFTGLGLNAGSIGSGEVRMNMLVAVEDIAVPYNGGTTFTGCLKIFRSRTTSVHQVDWYCPGVGYAKSALTNNSGTYVTRELSDIIY